MLKRKTNINLRNLRRQNNLSQAQMAKLLDMGKATYNRKENGITEFTESEITKVALLFGKNPMDIFFGDYVTERTTNIKGCKA